MRLSEARRNAFQEHISGHPASLRRTDGRSGVGYAKSGGHGDRKDGVPGSAKGVIMVNWHQPSPDLPPHRQFRR
jgi:hypothetical protein